MDEDRPCRGAATILAGQCPPVGDWSFPSNHATIAGALATAVLLLSPRWGLLAAPLALLAALSRVFVGVHYPHDVPPACSSASRRPCWSPRWRPAFSPRHCAAAPPPAAPRHRSPPPPAPATEPGPTLDR